MRNTLALLLVAVSSLSSITAQNGHDITIKVPEFRDTSALFAFHYGDQKLISDTVYFDSKGVVNIKGNEPLPRGMYLLVTPPQRYFEMIVADDQTFSMTARHPDYVETMEIEGSVENELFYNDMRHIMEKRSAYEAASKRFQEIKDTKPDSADILKEKMTALDSEVRGFREKIKEEHPETFYATFLKALEEPEVPEIPVDEETGKADSSYPYRYFKKHFLEDVDFTESGLIRTPSYHQKVVRYMTELTPQIPDSVISSADKLLSKAQQDSTLYQYTLAWMLNRYAKREIMGMDEVYVHLAEEYYMKGKAPWVSKSQLKRIVQDAMALKPLLIGKQAPDVIGETPENEILSLYKVEAPYTILAFWDADCGHCRKEMPKLYKSWEEELKPMGVKVYSPSVEYTTDRWLKFLEEKGMKADGWINVIDTEGLDDYRTKYDIKATPVIFVLDDDKTIIAKWLGVEQIVDFIKNYEKRNKETDGDPSSFTPEK